jgi:hypothetical protein
MDEVAILRADPASVAIEGILAPTVRVGSIFIARRTLIRREPFAIVDESAAGVTGIWADGIPGTLSSSRLGKEVLPAEQEVRSAAGRIHALIFSALPHLTKDCLESLTVRLHDMLEVPGHAVGLLLDREPLGLAFSDALALPIEGWRVRYEFLRSDPTDARERRELAMQIVQDPSAPRGVRIRVAVSEELDLTLIDSHVAGLFIKGDATAAMTDLIAEDLAKANSDEAGLLRQAVDSPASLATSSNTAAALAHIGGTPPPVSQDIEVADLPTSIIDDLIDRGVSRFNLTRVSVDAQVDGIPELPLRAYVLGRLAPSDLGADELKVLQFTSEAYRRYILGDDEVAEGLSQPRLNDARVARALKRGEIPSDVPTDERLVELVSLLGGNGSQSPSETLLDDLSLWPTLVNHGVVGSAQASVRAAIFADVSALNGARSALFEWDWARAATLSRERLRGARREAVRDELLNTMACALWLQDRPESALAALDSALEGEYSDALLTNAAVVAGKLEPSEAVDRFVKLAREAPNPQQRAMAAERALVLWQNDDQRIWDDDNSGIPDEILEALRPLLGQSISEDRYRRIVSVLANNDDEWLAAQPMTAFGAHSDSTTVRVYRARAQGIGEFITTLSDELTKPDHERWLAEERDNLVSAAVKVLIDNNHELGAAFFGMTLVEANIPMEPVQRIPLVCLTVAAIAQNIDTDEGEPKDLFIDWVANANRETAGLDEGGRDTFGPLVALAGESLARSFARSRARQLREADDVFDKVTGQIRSMQPSQINHQAVQEVLAPISQFCRDSWEVLNRVRPLVRDPGVLSIVDTVMTAASDLGNRAFKVR